VKQRAGFVSNSSSSSFIVAFPFIPRNPSEVETLLFPNGEKYSEQFENIEFATTVFSDMQGKLPLTMDEIIEEFSSGWLIDMDDWDAEHRAEYEACFKDSSFNEFYEKKRKEEMRRSKILAKKWTKDNPDRLFFSFQYGDESGSYFSQMEHGGLFSNLPNKQISLH